MAKLQVNIHAKAGGSCNLTLSFGSAALGGVAARARFRIRRTAEGHADAILPGVAEFGFTAATEIRSWSWNDVNIPASVEYVYKVEIMRLEGNAQFSNMLLIAQHTKR